MSKKSRDAECAAILTIVELEAEIAALQAKARYLSDAHRERTHEALRIPMPDGVWAAFCDDCGKVSDWYPERFSASGAADSHSHETGHSVSAQRAA